MNERKDEIRALTLDASSASVVASAEGDGNTLVGYPIVFNDWTTIDNGYEGRFREQIAPSALKRRLEGATQPRSHGANTATTARFTLRSASGNRRRTAQSRRRPSCSSCATAQ